MSRQEEMLKWAVDTFGECAKGRDERAMRMIEEAIEVAQTVGLPLEAIIRIAERTYSRPVGEIENELGGLGVSSEILAEQLGYNFNDCTRKEFDRVSSIPKEHWQRKHADKVAAGTANGDGPLILRDDQRAFWKGHQLQFSASEFRMVALLSSQPGYSRTYRELYDLVKTKGFQAGRGAEGFRVNVRTFLKRIRMKFLAVDPEFDRIQNYNTVGYVWKK